MSEDYRFEEMRVHECEQGGLSDAQGKEEGDSVRDFYYYYYLELMWVNIGMVLMFNLSVPRDLLRRTCVLGSRLRRLLSCNSSPINYNQDESHYHPLPNPSHIPPIQMPLSTQQLLSLTTSVGLNVPPPPCLPI